MKKIISVLMSTVLFLTTIIILSAGNIAGAIPAPEIYLTAPNQYYIAGEEITFDMKIPVDVIKDVVYVQLFIDCNTDVLKFRTADQSKGELAVTETEKGYTIDFYPWSMATNTETYRATLTFRVSKGDIDVNAHALLQYRDSDTTREARLADSLPNNTVFDADEVPRLTITGDLEIYRKEDTIYLPYPITKSELRSKISSTHKEYPVEYKVLNHKETEYALTGDELFVNFDGRQGEIVRISILGDADNNGIVTAADARKVLRYSAQLEPFPEFFDSGCDLDNVKGASAGDARKILRVAAKIDSFDIPDFTIIEGRYLTVAKLLNAGSGLYNWRCTVSDENAFEITEEITPPAPEDLKPGTPFEQSFTFKGLKPGTYDVHFELIANHEDEPIDEFYFTVTVHIDVPIGNMF
ncbi:MAG: protease inhibitor I42 family protein [Clostridia bacterium]|nr:protease inhibitor I42 family protein [Clostridia bacterium]